MLFKICIYRCLFFCVEYLIFRLLLSFSNVDFDRSKCYVILYVAKATPNNDKYDIRFELEKKISNSFFNSFRTLYLCIYNSYQLLDIACWTYLDVLTNRHSMQSLYLNYMSVCMFFSSLISIIIITNEMININNTSHDTRISKNKSSNTH